MDDKVSIGKLIRGKDLSWPARASHGLIAVLSAFYVYIHLYAGIFGAPDTQLMNSLHVTIALILVFMTSPLVPRTSPRYSYGLAFDLVCVVGAIICATYFLIEIETWTMRTVIFRNTDLAVGLLFCFLILEAVRRVIGLTLVVICLVFVLYAIYANHFPGVFYGAPVAPIRLLQTVFLGDAGIFGIAVSVMAQYVVIFILFGTLLNKIGGGQFFTRIAFSLFGRRRGGPAKAAVMSSAMMGTLSGSAIGNVVTTGIFTIPLMIKLGYKRAFAGGVEAAASNGGMIMPPVMGAVAFIMADMMGRSYVDIVAAAAIPAVLYYMTMFVTVDLEARKLGLKPIEKGALPRARDLMMRQGYYLLPLVVVTVALFMNYSIIMVGVISVAVTALIGIIQRRGRLDPGKLFEAVEETTKSTASLSVTAAAAGIMLGAIYATGLSYQISQEAAQIADGHLWALVLLCGLLAIIMGMGMSAPAVYITLAATIVPIMKLAGIPEMAAHFYAFYFGIASNITPPVALTAYAASPIAGSKPMETGLHAGRLGIACLLLPILFIYHPAILLEGAWYEVIEATITTALALIGFAAAMTGFVFRTLSGPQRLTMLVAALLLFTPELLTSGIGALIMAMLMVNNCSGPDNLHRKLAEAQSAKPELEIPDGWFSRLMARRTSKELAIEGAQVLSTTDQNHEEMLASLNEESPHVPSAFSGWSLAAAWLVVLIVGGLFEYAGSQYLHASEPRQWVALMFGAAVVSVLGLFLAFLVPGIIPVKIAEQLAE
jgi:TRAP transporter 4TM/12TM fusion protein